MQENQNFEAKSKISGGSQDAEFRQIFKGGWFKAKILTMSKEFVEFLEDESMQIDEVVLNPRLRLI
jgi:hypothetical protein